MKETLIFLVLILMINKTYAQDVVVNEKLLMQLSKDHAVRFSSENLFLKSYKKQNEYYDNIKNKITQVVATQEYIYHQLTNVNSALRQSKKLMYLFRDIEKIGTKLTKMIKLSKDKPQYSALLSKYYTYIYEQSIQLKKEINDEILRENKDFLMDSMDREILIEKIYSRVRNINGSLTYIILRLENAKSIPYFYQVPILRDYISIDREIVNSAINKYNNILNK